ncbi:MAG: penicillin-binding transpeptidase domain-containing protein [Clostridium sp.]
MQTYNRQHKTDGVTPSPDQVPGITQQMRFVLFGLPGSLRNQKWRNYDIHCYLFEPGSPSKIFTVAAALEEGVISPNDTFYCDGYREVAGRHPVTSVQPFGRADVVC